MAFPSQEELSELRADYLHKREQLLIKRVDALGVTLFDKVYKNYLSKLEESDGRLVYNNENISLVKGLDKIYTDFTASNNIPVINGFVGDLRGITPLNERYFSGIRRDGIKAITKRVSGVVDKRLGIDANGKPVKNGFTDKFIRDKTLLKTLQAETTKALTNKMGFQEFRKHIRETIQGNPNQQLSGGLQQYYRNYAYDTFLKVDRLNQDLYAKDLGLRYFIWSGGVIKTSRPLCVHCNGKIVDSDKFKNLDYSDIKTTFAPNGSGKRQPFNSGLDKTWVPMDDLGQYGCRHRKDYITNSVADRMRGRWLDVNSLLG